MSFDILLALPAFALVLFRLSGLVLTAPIFASRMVPIRLRAGLVFVVAAMMFPVLSRQVPDELTLSGAVIGGVGELMIGATIGLSLTIMLMGAEVAGLMIGRQAGIALANVFDPARNAQTTTMGQLYSIALVLLFLAAGGHRAAMAALLDTFEVIPLLTFEFDKTFVVLLAEVLTAAFILGIRLAAPALCALFLVSTALAFLSRTMPQLNILSVGFTVRALIAVAASALVLGSCQELMLDAVWDGMEMIYETFGLDPDRIKLVN